MAQLAISLGPALHAPLGHANPTRYSSWVVSAWPSLLACWAMGQNGQPGPLDTFKLMST